LQLFAFYSAEGYLQSLGATKEIDKIMVSAKRYASIPFWIARSLSVIVIGFLFLFLFGEGLSPITVLHICFPFSVMLGLILAWFFEGIGASITIVSIAAFYLIHYFHEGKLPGGPFFLISGAPSVFFLMSMFIRKNMTMENTRLHANDNK
jgi:hypothetical protein